MSGTRASSTTSRRELSSSFFFLQGKAPKEIHGILTQTLACFRPGRAKDLSAPLYIQRNIEARSCSHCCSRIAISITYRECVFVALGTQHALRMHHTVLPSVACPALLYFCTFSHKRYDLRKTKLFNIKCVLIFSTTFL